MRFWLGMSVSVVGVFALGLMAGWWLRGKFSKNELRAAEEMIEGLPDIWPGERRS